MYLEGDLLAEAEKMQQSAMEVDERVGMVEEYLNTMLPDDWDSMDLFQRRNYLSGSEFGSPVHEAKELRTEVSNAEIWCECFDKSLQELKPTDSYSIAALMSQIGGWERTTTIKRQPLQVWRLGTQECVTTQLFPLYSKSNLFLYRKDLCLYTRVRNI